VWACAHLLKQVAVRGTYYLCIAQLRHLCLRSRPACAAAASACTASCHSTQRIATWSDVRRVWMRVAGIRRVEVPGDVPGLAYPRDRSERFLPEDLSKVGSRVEAGVRRGVGCAPAGELLACDSYKAATAPWQLCCVCRCCSALLCTVAVRCCAPQCSNAATVLQQSCGALCTYVRLLSQTTAFKVRWDGCCTSLVPVSNCRVLHHPLIAVTACWKGLESHEHCCFCGRGGHSIVVL
jgi:hypothetical protein